MTQNSDPEQARERIEQKRDELEQDALTEDAPGEPKDQQDSGANPEDNPDEDDSFSAG